MPGYYSYTIEPLQGRDEIRRFFQKSVDEKIDKYNNRRVTLNERFSLIERGFKLSPILPNDTNKCSNTFLVREIPYKEVNVLSEKNPLRERSENQK